MERRNTARLRVRAPLVAAVLASGWFSAAPPAGGEPAGDTPTDRYWQFLEHTDDPSLRLLPALESSDQHPEKVVDGPTLLPPMHFPTTMEPPSPAGSGMVGDSSKLVDLEDFVAGPDPNETAGVAAPTRNRPQPAGPSLLPLGPSLVEEQPAGRPTVRSEASAESSEPSAESRTPRLSEYTATLLPTGSRVQQLAEASVQRGYAFAKRGAYFTAEREFIEALKLVTRQKDLQSSRSSRSEALSAGLRALDEAEDFFPGGMQVQAELDLASIRASHLTKLDEPLEDQTQAQHVLDLYLRYAQVQLGAAVSGEPAGSMALHALGKLQSQLGRVEPARNPIAAERAAALQQAALLARSDNYLAAHELGLLLAEAGRLQRAEALLAGVAADQPNAVVLRNLAAVQRKRGQHLLAQQSLAQAEALARAGRGGGAGVQTVSPRQFAQTSARSQAASTPQAGRSASPSGPGGSSLRVAGRGLFHAEPTNPATSPNPGSRSGTDFVSPTARWR
ncbi:MAG: tetratricopeptide repeat protein [Planctomycetota bacterium]